MDGFMRLPEGGRQQQRAPDNRRALAYKFLR